MENITNEQILETVKSNAELKTLVIIEKALKKCDEETKVRILKTVAIFYDINLNT